MRNSQYARLNMLLIILKSGFFFVFRGFGVDFERGAYFFVKSIDLWL